MIELGVAYYPEQWPRDRWAADAALMREASFRLVRMGEFAWANLEPEIGRFEFDWLDTAITTLATAGLRVVLGTPTAAPPAWLTFRLADEVLLVGPDGRQRQPGSRRHCCVTSEAYQRHAARIVEALAERYGRHPAVAGWQIDNELGCHDTARCYCRRCASQFRVFLERRYDSLQALNQAWGTQVWSQGYGDWAEVLPPAGLVYRANPGHWLDWCRFASFNAEQFLAQQAEILRYHAENQWIAHNFMGRFDDLDHAALAQHLDLAGYDHYAPSGMEPDEAALELDRIRGLKQRGFVVLEQQPGNIDWDDYNPALRPGQARLMTLQAIAHGADAVLYWQWRAPCAGAEQLHGAILPHDGRPGRTFAELHALAGDLGALPDLGTGRSPIALLRGDPDRWALRLQPHSADLAAAGPDAYERDYYRALWAMGQDVDVVPPGSDLAGYRVVVAPTAYMADDGLAKRLADHVSGGGLLVLGARCGFKNQDNQVWPQGAPGPLQSLAGVRVLEFDAPPPTAAQAIGFEDGAWFQAGAWRERLEVLTGGEIVARYLDDYLSGEPVIVSRMVGEGRVWYVGTIGKGPELAEHLMRLVLAEAGLAPAVIPSGIEIRTRPGPRGPIRFVLNHTGERKAIGLDEDGVDLLTGMPCSGILELQPLGAAVLAPP